MSAESGGTGVYRIMVAVETDATRYYGPDASRPALLEETDAETLLAHLASDLKALFPEISACSLIAAGALFDQTQVLRPGYPVFQALEAASTARDAAHLKPGLVSIGASGGRMPVEALQPLENIPLGLLQLLPLVVHGPAGLVAELGQAMEYRFLEEGQLSAHSANWLQSAFGIEVTHARMMTLTDLNAMLRLQLDHFGFLPLWELLDAAMTASVEALTVTTALGRDLSWRDGRVNTEFETFDHWATQGAGSKVSARRQGLAEGYGDWTRELRQYLTTLKAHGLEIRFTLPGQNETLPGTFFAETSPVRPTEGDSSITEHSFGETGTIVITAVNGDVVENYYPLSAPGLNDIHAHLRENLPGQHTVAFPGTILYDEKRRCLLPDNSAPGSPDS